MRITDNRSFYVKKSIKGWIQGYLGGILLKSEGVKDVFKWLDKKLSKILLKKLNRIFKIRNEVVILKMNNV